MLRYLNGEPKCIGGVRGLVRGPNNRGTPGDFLSGDSR